MAATSESEAEAPFEVKGSQRRYTSISSNDCNKTTSTPLDEKQGPVVHPQRQSPPHELKNSPFAPSKAIAWPDEKSKGYWVGPFDMYYNTNAKTARDAG